jgi:HAD superfamily hydrolase (TIGR01509 family)
MLLDYTVGYLLGEGCIVLIKAVIFDLDGVLMDSEPYYHQKRMEYFESFGVHLTQEELYRFVGQGFQEALKKECGFLPDEIYRAILQHFVPWPIDCAAFVRPHARAVVSTLRAMGLKVAIASNSVPEKIQSFIADCGFTGLIDIWTSRKETGRGKPAPDLYLMTAHKLELPPADCAAVEDSDCGLQAAYSAGCYVCCLIEKRFAFQQRLAHVWIDDLDELANVMQCGV